MSCNANAEPKILPITMEYEGCKRLRMQNGVGDDMQGMSLDEIFHFAVIHSVVLGLKGVNVGLKN
ncbi:hypothetical protein RJ641_001780 [Dillenia turbinata]|uniref:Uncharacterized protein n=1 Tax=Dillenia turbinata TaxID=194707 RepID=A0AAN8VLY5_9MAGN